MGRTKRYCFSLSVGNLCMFKERKNLTLKTCAPDFSTRLMTKIYIQKSRARVQSHSFTSRLAKRREILIFPRIVGNTGNSRELLVIHGNYWEISSSPTRKV